MQQQGQLFCHVCRTCPPDRTGPQERRSSGGLGVGFLGRGPYVAGVGVQVIRAGPCHTWAGPGPFFQGEPGPRVGAVPALFYRPNGMPIPPPKIGAWQGVGARFHRPLNGHGAAPGAAVSAVPERPAFRFFQTGTPTYHQPTTNLAGPIVRPYATQITTYGHLFATYRFRLFRNPAGRKPGVAFPAMRRNAVPDRRQRLGPGHLFQVPDSPHNPPSLPMNCAFHTGYDGPFFGQSFTRADTPCPRYARRNGAASSLSRGRVAGANRREPKQGGLGPKSWPGRLQLGPMRAGLRQGLGLGGLSP